MTGVIAYAVMIPPCLIPDDAKPQIRERRPLPSIGDIVSSYMDNLKHAVAEILKYDFMPGSENLSQKIGEPDIRIEGIIHDADNSKPGRAARGSSMTEI